MFSFIHAADIHLDSPLYKLDHYEGAPVEELRQATRRAFENLVDLAIAKGVDFVLIAGDLYDGDWKDYNSGLFFVSQMSRLRKADISAYIVAGNHDAASKITKTLRLPEGVELLPAKKATTLRLDKIGVAIHGQSFATPAVRENLSVDYPSPLPGCFNIGILHTCVTGREGHESYAPCKIEELSSKGYDYWALGHVHQQEILLDNPHIVFPGNIQGRNIRETGPKGCMLVSVNDTGQAGVEFQTLDVIRWTKIEVDASDTENGYELVDLIGRQLEERLDKNDGMPLVARIEISGASKAHNELSSDFERWANEIRSNAIDISGGRTWIEKVKVRTTPPMDGETIESDGGPVEELIQCINEFASEPERLKTLGMSLADLASKLPRELREGPEGITLDNHEWLAEVLEQVRPMLLSRLLRKEGSV